MDQKKMQEMGSNMSVMTVNVPRLHSPVNRVCNIGDKTIKKVVKHES